MKTSLGKYVGGLFLAAALARAQGQSTWNYFISDAGGGNSLVTWNVTGSLATAPGAVLLLSEPSLAVSIVAPGIYADAYVTSAAPQPLPTLEGSYFQYPPANVFAPLTSYFTDNPPANGNDRFGLIAQLLPHTGPGTQLLYHPGTQATLIPVDFSNFNPGSYQSEASGFNSVLTVNLSVVAVPEPTTLTFAVGVTLGGAITRVGRKLRKDESRAARR